MSNEPSRISLDELNRPESEQDPRINRSKEKIQKLKTRLKQTGWLAPIKLTSDDYTIIDGVSRFLALKELEDDSEYKNLKILGQFSGFTYVMPDIDVDIDPEEASAELNTYRKNLTDADRANYLDLLIKKRVKNNDDSHVARDVPTTELLAELEPDREWTYSDQTKTQIEGLLSTLDFDSPEAARNKVSFYEKAPELVRDSWALDEINYSHVEELTRIHERLEQGADLAGTSARHGHNFRDLVEYSNEDDYRGQDEYYTRTDLREIVNELDQLLKQKESEEELLDAIGADENQREKIQELTDEWDSSTESVVGNILDETSEVEPSKIEELDDEELDDKIEEEQQLIEEEVKNNIGWREKAEARTQSERENIREQELGELTEDDWDSSYAEPAAFHKAPPLVEKDIQVFFHDSADIGGDSTYSGSMGDEIDDESVDLFFFSPPYYVQRGTIDTYDGYDGYLADMRQVFSSVYEKLKPHRYFLLNISDHTTTGGQENQSGKRLPIQSDVSSMISREIGFEYEGTIRWYKPNPTSSQRASHYFEKENTKGQPLYYYPEDRIEEIFIFRKGERDQEAVYREAMDRFDEQFDDLETFREAIGRDNPKEAFQHAFTEKVDLDKFSDIYKTDLWPIVPTASNEGITTHTAGYPKRLAKLVVQLYSLPGDRIADPMVGFGSTLAAIQDLNKESEFEVHREGLGWENFEGEQEDQPDYYEVIQRMLGSEGIDEFLSPA